jgi:hypothetical protein
VRGDAKRPLTVCWPRDGGARAEEPRKEGSLYRRARRLYSLRKAQETAAAAAAAESRANTVASGSRSGGVNAEDVSRAAEAGASSARDDTPSTASAAAVRRGEQEELPFKVVSNEEFRKRVEKRKLTIGAYDQLKLRVDSTTTCVDEGICLSAYDAQVGFPCQVPKLPRHPKWEHHERRLAGDFTPPPPPPPWRGPVQVRHPCPRT